MYVYKQHKRAPRVRLILFNLFMLQSCVSAQWSSVRARAVYVHTQKQSIIAHAAAPDSI